MSNQSSRGGQWEKVRTAVLNRDQHVCGYCGNEATTVDHVIPKAAGGTDDETNLVAACHKCNVDKGAKTLIRNTWYNTKWMDQL